MVQTFKELTNINITLDRIVESTAFYIYVINYGVCAYYEYWLPPANEIKPIIDWLIDYVMHVHV